MLNKWLKLTQATHYAAVVPNLSPLTVIGGTSTDHTVSTADISIFDGESKIWKQTGASLTFSRFPAVAAAVNSNAIIVIGGCTNRSTVHNAVSSSLTTVEMGQVKLLQRLSYTLMQSLKCIIK